MPPPPPSEGQENAIDEDDEENAIDDDDEGNSIDEGKAEWSHYRGELEAIYQVHCPEKLHSLDHLMQRAVDTGTKLPQLLQMMPRLCLQTPWM